jgi:hypothetical protein
MSAKKLSPFAASVLPFVAIHPNLPAAKPAQPLAKAHGVTTRTLDTPPNTNARPWALVAPMLAALGTRYHGAKNLIKNPATKLVELPLGNLHPDLGGMVMLGTSSTALCPFILATFLATQAAAAGDEKPIARILANPLAALETLPAAITSQTLAEWAAGLPLA